MLDRFLLAPAALLLAVAPFLGCTAKKPAAEPSPASAGLPVLYSEDVVRRATALSDSAYIVLGNGKGTDAIALFQQAGDLTPASVWGPYNLACAYSRLGDVEKAFAQLNLAVQAGWDDPDHLTADADLTPLRGDSRFAGLVAQATASRSSHLAYLAQGVPVVQLDRKFANGDSITAWAAGEYQRYTPNARLLTGWQRAVIEVDLQARKIAAYRTLAPPDTTFHEFAARMGALTNIYGLDESWGPVADGVLKEAQTSLQSNPAPGVRDAAAYWSAVASYCRAQHPPQDPEWAEAVKSARAWLDKVPDGSFFAGGRNAWELMFDLKAPGADAAKIKPRLREFAARYGDDSYGRYVASSLFFNDLIHALWPLPIAAKDLQGQPVSLGQYHGKVLLLDFWATWCGPCRAELPHVQEAYQKYHSQGLEILSVSLDYTRHTTPEDYRLWVTDHQMPWRHIYDGQDWKGPLVKEFQVSAIPAPFLIGRDGSLEAMGEDCRGEKLDAAIERALHKGV